MFNIVAYSVHSAAGLMPEYHWFVDYEVPDGHICPVVHVWATDANAVHRDQNVWN